MLTDPETEPLSFRTVFLSDLHLGSRGCQADLLLDLLRRIRAERIYLVGDVVDGWRLRRKWYWPPEHHQVLRRLLEIPHDGTEVVYVPGNHDELLRVFCDQLLGGFSMVSEAVHHTADGRRLLVVHGDLFEGWIEKIPTLAALSDSAYGLLARATAAYNRLRRRLGMRQLAIAAVAKTTFLRLSGCVDRFERAMIREARRHGADGVVCGHIHQARLREVDGLVYANSGDWVGSGSILVERLDGSLDLLRWQQPAVPGAEAPGEPLAASPLAA